MWLAMYRGRGGNASVMQTRSVSCLPRIF
jgi:hypothetical protein